LDESTRLRNRIAELESLVRELRGKPHPRWAESSFRDGDPNEKWHSRATKCVPLPKRNGQQPQQQQTTQSQQSQLPDDMLRNGRAGLNPIKTEPTQDPNSQLYRFSPSPAPSMRYHTFQADVRSDSSSSFDNDPRPGFNPTNGSGMYPTNATHYTSGTGSTAPSTYSDGGGGVTYPLSNSDDGNTSYGDHFSVNSSSPQSHFLCACRSNPALGITYLQLSQTVQQSLNSMRQYNHSSNSHCVLFRRVLELSNTLHGGESPGLVGAAYDSGPPSDNEIITPLSASSGPASFHTGTGSPGHDWGQMAAAGFNPYFPSADHSVYNVSHVLP